VTSRWTGVPLVSAPLLAITVEPAAGAFAHVIPLSVQELVADLTTNPPEFDWLGVRVSTALVMLCPAGGVTENLR